jgi:glycosyltransferase involved in cell wall biosynthesis
MPISGLLARAAARSVGTAHIAYTCHGFLFNQPGPAWRRQLSLALERAAGPITHTYMTVSEEEAADAKRLGIHRNPIAIGNGRDPAIFRPDAAARARLRAELGAEGCVVMGTARLVRHKGWPDLLLAMRDLPGATLWVVGERLSSDHGDDLDGDFAEAARLLGPRLKMLGYRHDVAALLAAADIFCLPSHFEGLPMSIIEAMLAGLPVVATDIRGPREQVVDGQTGFLVPAGEAAPLAQALGRLVAEVMIPNLWAFSHRESRVGVVMHATVRLGETQFMVHCLPPRDTDRSGGKGAVCAVKRRRVVGLLIDCLQKLKKSLAII